MSKQEASDVGHLVLKRKQGESITIDGNVNVQFVEVAGGHVRVRISAPRNIVIVRDEIAIVEA